MTPRAQNLREVDHPQLRKLYALMDAAADATPAARTGDLFASKQGKALLLAAHDLFEVDGLYHFAQDVEHEISLLERSAA